jgi:quinoprotein glucose dehydrogenase
MRLGKILLVLSVLFCVSCKRYGADSDWTAYGGGPDQIRYSRLDQIDRSNVSRLRQAWTYDTGDVFKDSEMQCNPLVVDGVLYATTPRLRVIALDAAAGTLKWSFDPHNGREVKNKQRNRGLIYWSDGTERRIYFGAGHDLWSLDADTGRPVPGFGNEGRVDLREGLGRDPASLSVTLTTPGVVYRDLLIVGSLVPEGLPSAPGDIRAYELKTGKPRWTFHTIPRPGEFGHDTWPANAWQYAGGANSWCGMALDAKRGIVFIPTGSAAFDFYGANRHGDNLFANCLLALKADTGERLWHFQAVRHDVWDRDFPSPPSLVQVKRDGRTIDAVAQITKSGHVYVFERETGKPLFPLETRKVPPSDVDGESLSAEQVLPAAPPPFARQRLTEDMLTHRTPEAHQFALERFRGIRSGDQFAPPTLQGTIVFPGFDGGGEWGGSAFDPESHLLYVNSNEMAWILRLVPAPAAKAVSTPRELYGRHCAACHREDLKGTPPEFPSLVGIGKKYSEARIGEIVRNGAGRMPGFGGLQPAVLGALIGFIARGDNRAEVAADAPSPMDLKYTTDGYNKFLDPEGYPAIEPPWGTLNAINLDSGEIAWKIPFGEFPLLAAKGVRNTGTENYGGGVVTAGGLLFIGATNHDRKFHVFDKTNGKLLWETELPAAGNATPATYMAGGRQFVVIAAGGGKSGAPSGGSYVAFTLP